MQSEFACHIGLQGKLFCQICKVFSNRGARGSGEVEDAAEDEFRDASDSYSEATGDGDADSSFNVQQQQQSGEPTGKAKKKSRRKKAVEGMQDMVDRVKRFLQVCFPQSS